MSSEILAAGKGGKANLYVARIEDLKTFDDKYYDAGRMDRGRSERDIWRIGIEWQYVWDSGKGGGDYWQMDTAWVQEQFFPKRLNKKIGTGTEFK